MQIYIYIYLLTYNNLINNNFFIFGSFCVDIQEIILQFLKYQFSIYFVGLEWINFTLFDLNM